MHKLIEAFVLKTNREKMRNKQDGPVKFLGPNHRILYHDPVSAFIAALSLNKFDIPNLLKDYQAALLHILTDKLFDGFNAAAKKLVKGR